MNSEVIYTRDLTVIDWHQLKADLSRDRFDNGRTPEQLQRSFENSRSCCFACIDGRVVGKARVLSDGVCNAYVVDVWTSSAYRRRGIATTMMERLLEELPGQHVYLQADDDVVEFYEKLGFAPQPHGLSRVVGHWLQYRDAVAADGAQ